MEPQELTAGLAAGDEAAWRVFLEDYGRLILSVINRFALPPQEREDLFQDACLTTLRSVGTLRDPRSLSTWLYRTTYRLCIDAHRRRRPEHPVEYPGELAASLEPQDRLPVPGDELERLEAVAILRDSIQRLDPACRNLLSVLYLQQDDPSYRQVSERLGIPIGSIGPTRARCLEKAKQVYESLSRPSTRASFARDRKRMAGREGRGRPSNRGVGAELAGPQPAGPQTAGPKPVGPEPAGKEPSGPEPSSVETRSPESDES